MRSLFNFVLSTLLFLIVFIPSLTAEQIVLFQMTPNTIPLYNENKILALWNPRENPEIHKSGVKIFFFGKAEGCKEGAKNGPVKIILPNQENTELTGLPISKKGKVFVPIPDRSLCLDINMEWSKGSYVYVSEDPLNGGIGLFTASGVDKKGRPYFFQARDELGVGGGINKFEKSTAFTWKLEKDRSFPFKNRGSLEIIVNSSVEALPSITERRKLPTQVRQQIEIGFANKECLRNKKTEKILCLNKYVFDFLVKRWGGKPLDERRGCLIFVDKAQGGLSHIACYSKPSGTRILEKRTQLDMATSCGEGLQQTTFRDKNFCYTISWTQFMNSLKAIASNHLNKPVQQVTEKDLRSLFSESYLNPEAWYITIVSFQQELHDPYKDRNVYIGGNIKEIKILQE